MRPPKHTSIAQKKINSEMLKKRKDGQAKSKKASSKSSGAPKRPPSAFLVFMEDFRKSFKENHPDNKSIATVGKAGGEKWKSMSENEKAPYLTKAKLKKDDYEKALGEFKMKTAGNAVDAEKSNSEVHDGDLLSS